MLPGQKNLKNSPLTAFILKWAFQQTSDCERNLKKKKLLIVHKREPLQNSFVRHIGKRFDM